MTKRLNKQQLELPILTDVKLRTITRDSVAMTINSSSKLEFDSMGFHKPASKEDQSIYQSITDSYFGILTK